LPGGAPPPTALSPDQLRWRCDPADLGGPSTATIAPSADWIGDPRARAAVELALELSGPSHNLLLRGTPGTGRASLLRQCLAAATTPDGELVDRVFAQRLADPARPRLLTFPAATGRAWVAAADDFSATLHDLEGSTRKAALPRVRKALARLRALSTGREARDHVAELRAAVLDDLALFRSSDPATRDERRNRAGRVRARLIRDASRWRGRPVLELTRADRRSLLGGVDVPPGDDAPGLGEIAAGALVEADGGVCVIPAELLVGDTALVEELVRVLRAGEIELRATPGSGSPSLEDYRPDPVPIRTRVVITGTRSPGLGPLLTMDARRAFGLVTDCPPSIPWNRECGHAIAGFVAHACREHALLHATNGAVAELVEQQVRDVEGRLQVSTALGTLLDRLREADRLARQLGKAAVDAEAVRAALVERRWRAGRAEERHRRRLARERLQVRTMGREIGIVNALLVYTVDGHRYGAPSRITATTAVGREGVINIERESKLSGKTFDKGVFEIAGFLRARFCQRDPLGMAAAVTFEQSYGRIDGDSAAAAEAAAILSDLAAAPVHQTLALTGSLSQRGEVQAVGGVNEKIEGFWRTCRDRGPVPDQGVIIPKANVEDLVLDPDVVRAARRGEFTVHAVETLGQAMTLLTGIPAGEPDGEGRYGADTVFGRVQARLELLSARLFPPRKLPRKPPRKPPSQGAAAGGTKKKSRTG
jgi:predicted ATP-dependent protease